MTVDSLRDIGVRDGSIRHAEKMIKDLRRVVAIADKDIDITRALLAIRFDMVSRVGEHDGYLNRLRQEPIG